MAMLLEGTADHRPAGSSRLTDAMNRATASLSSKVDDWADRLEDVAAGTAQSVKAEVGEQAAKGLEELKGDGDAKQQATIAGVAAGISGKNPLWAALKAAWSQGGAATRAVIVTAIVGAVLLLVLSPVLLLVFLLSLLIIAAVMKARSAAR